MNPRRLYRSRSDRQLAGVAAGMAEYLGLDPTLLRVLWVISVFFGGFSIFLYIILAFVMPSAPFVSGPIPYPGWSPGDGPAAGPAAVPTAGYPGWPTPAAPGAAPTPGPTPASEGGRPSAPASENGPG